MTPADFLHILYGQFEGGWLTLFTIDRNGERFTDWYEVTETETLAKHALAMDDRNVWFGVATRSEQLDGGRRGGAEHCLQLPALFIDVDIAGPNHKDSNGLPTTEAQALELIDKFPLRPSIIVRSGGGLHAYWLFDEPVGHDDSIAMLKRWGETWAQIATKMKLRVDNVFDLPRVLRLPGTLNLKNDKVVEVLDARELRYGYSEFHDVTVDPPQRQYRSSGTLMPVVGTRPGDVFNQRHAAGHVLALDGWRHARTDAGSGNETWLHPWNPSSDCSATVYRDDGHCTVWSDTAAQHRPVEVRTPYDPFGLYVRLVHDGDFVAASRQLIKDGYGERVDVTVVTMPNGKCRPKHKIRTGTRHLDDLANEVVDELTALNDPPRLFTHGDTVSRFEGGELRPVDRTVLMHIVESSLQPIKVNKDGDETPSRIDTTALDLVLYRLLHDLPVVEGVARSPFLRFDGTICTDVGWDEGSRMFLASSVAVNVPTTPTPGQVAGSVALIDEMIADFPLSGPSDRAHIFALLLTMSTRHLVPLVPLFVLDGNGPGVGKNLLSEAIAYVATGEWAQTDPLPLDAEEQRKQITSMLSTGRSVALFDEAHIISGVSLARLITSTTWGDRLLGYSKQVSYPNKITVIALGNNVEVQGDMPRRSILIRLSSDLARPEMRSDFKHDNLRAWVTEHRSDLLSAALTILRNWAAQGKPRGGGRLGSFDQWVDMIGGALEVAGVGGFLANVDEMRTRGATDDMEMADHIAELHAWYSGSSFTTADVGERLTYKQIETWPPKVGHDAGRMVAQLGYAYRRASSRWFGELMMRPTGRGHNNVKRWEIVQRGSEDVTPSSDLTTLVASGTPEHQSPRVADQPHETVLPQLSGGDGGDGGDDPSYTRDESKPLAFVDGGGEVSPPSPPSPPSRTVVEADPPTTPTPDYLFGPE